MKLTDEWTEAEMLAREKAVLGFYITRHPLASHEALLNACSTASTVMLSKCPDGQRVILGGMVSSVRTVTTRNGRNAGRRLGIVTLEDLRGRIEAVVFPKDFADFQPLLMPDAIVFLEGEVDRKREEASLRVSRVIPKDAAVEAYGATLLLDVGRDVAVEPIVRLLREHQGDTRVYLNVAVPDGMVAQIECHAGLRVACTSSLISGLSDLLGSGRVRVLALAGRAVRLDPETPRASRDRVPEAVA